ncbi:ribonuclease III domain-containing protein [Lophiotrema nucula]|uniref:Ribonuclease III domain-containing protein n=1 Tax=Lophiotrema nucula TaxID=690887 RepID=A0A6A5YKZ4_9PLEO|nr:ribonuclease III domain-containing protein [Lophiotrema nucula]
MVQRPLSFAEICTMDEKLTRAEDIIGYIFKNKELGLEALQMAWANKQATNQPMILSDKTYYVPYNQRIARVGDKVLDLVLAEHWSSTGITKGHWIRTVREPLTSNAYLCHIGQMLGLDECARIDYFFPGGKVYGKHVADVVEALIGAAYFDGGFEAAKTVIESLGLLAMHGHLPSDKMRRNHVDDEDWNEKLQRLYEELDVLHNEFVFEKERQHLRDPWTMPRSCGAQESETKVMKTSYEVSLVH